MSTSKLYRLDMLSDAAKAAIDGERDPRKMLALFDRLTKRLFRAGTETVMVGEREAVLTANAMDEAEQTALLTPRKPAERKPQAKPATVAPAPAAEPSAVLARLSAMRSPMATGLSDQQRDHVRAVWAWEAFRAGNATALQDFPHLAAALSGAPAEEDDSETPLAVALDAVDHWSGRARSSCPASLSGSRKTMRRCPHGMHARRSTKRRSKAAQALIDAARAKMPATVKPDMRPAWFTMN